MKIYLTVLASSFLATACLIETDPGPPPPIVVGESMGTLTVDWTIDGSKDPDQCHQSAAATLDVIVTTTSGGTVGEFQEPCSAFATSINLRPGTYTADAVLIDENGVERTTAVPIDAFTIEGDDDLDIPIDFPARSFR